MLRPGERIGDWIVDSALAEGGMGAVYRVHSQLTDRLVAALKIMKPSPEPTLRARFVREAEALAALNHPVVVRVMEFAEDRSHGLLYLVMELAKGETLRDRIERGPMEPGEALAVFLPLAQGLDHAHGRGVFHRDIKPSNIILCADGGVRLVDFGIASQLAEPLTACRLGTLAYLPPEVFKGEKTEPAVVDVYAFGLMLHEALTGRRSFPVDPNLTPAAAAAAMGVRKLQPGAMELPETSPPRLRQLVRRATSPEAAARPSMREIVAILGAMAERRVPSPQRAHGQPVPAAAPTPVVFDATTRVPDPARPSLFGNMRTRSPRHLLVALGLALVAGMGGAAWLARSPEGEPQVAAATDQERQEPSPAGRGTPATKPAVSPQSTSPSPTSRHAAMPPSPAALVAAVSKAPAPLTPSPLPSGDFAPVHPGGREPASLRLSGADSTMVETAEENGASNDEELVSARLGGRWELTHRVEATAHEPLAGMRVGYRLTLEQEGEHVFGRGYKYSENGVVLPPDQRTTIEVDGHVVGQRLVLDFMESDASASHSGTIRLRISPQSGALQGSFASEAGQSRGSSVARRSR